MKGIQLTLCPASIPKYSLQFNPWEHFAVLKDSPSIPKHIFFKENNQNNFQRHTEKGNLSIYSADFSVISEFHMFNCFLKV